MRKVRSLFFNCLFLAAFLFGLFWAFYLNEFSGDDIPEAAAEAGVAMPLDSPWIEVHLQKMYLALMVEEEVVKKYDIGFGPGYPGRVGSGEASTPIGEFRVVAKSEREDIWDRGSRFIQISFPDLESADEAWSVGVLDNDDYVRIERAHQDATTPPVDTPLGGPLGIQGNYFPFRSRRFTDGSIALSNGEINELYEHVKVGTRVVIRNQ